MISKVAHSPSRSDLRPHECNLNNFSSSGAAGVIARETEHSDRHTQEGCQGICSDALDRGALEFKTRTQLYLGTPIPGTRYIAGSFGELGLDEESLGGPDRFLPSATMLDPPGQRLKLPDGASVQPRRASEQCLGNREILEGISKFVNATKRCTIFPELSNFTNCDRSVRQKRASAAACVSSDRVRFNLQF